MFTKIFSKSVGKIVGYGSIVMLAKILKNSSITGKQKLLKSCATILLAYLFSVLKSGPNNSKLNTLFGLGRKPEIVIEGFVKPGYEQVK